MHIIKTLLFIGLTGATIYLATGLALTLLSPLAEDDAPPAATGCSLACVPRTPRPHRCRFTRPGMARRCTTAPIPPKAAPTGCWC
ncbi:hypothetical protein HML84_19360 [Alcanivorax sp. IO_7]|nr:hypothetical protein HML84_19360 [Alcanivorax sp. IO_7]